MKKNFLKSCQNLHRSGFTVLEVMVSLGIVAIGLTAFGVYYNTAYKQFLEFDKKKSGLIQLGIFELHIREKMRLRDLTDTNPYSVNFSPSETDYHRLDVAPPNSSSTRIIFSLNCKPAPSWLPTSISELPHGCSDIANIPCSCSLPTNCTTGTVPYLKIEKYDTSDGTRHTLKRFPSEDKNDKIYSAGFCIEQQGLYLKAIFYSAHLSENKSRGTSTFTAIIPTQHFDPDITFLP